MKKIFLILMIFVLCSCNSKVDEPISVDDKEEEIIVPTVPEYVDDNPITVGLYQDGKLVKDVSAPIVNDLDIGSFDVYFTNLENVGSTNTKANFKKYYNTYENIDKYKIGFYISFNVGDKVMAGNILGPDKMYVVTPYIYNYLYDDVNQADGAWYSHVEKDQVKDNTIYSSIKLYAAEFTEQITSPITLTVFTYDDMDDFDEDGIYRGNSKYTITINRK